MSALIPEHSYDCAQCQRNLVVVCADPKYADRAAKLRGWDRTLTGSWWCPRCVEDGPA